MCIQLIRVFSTGHIMTTTNLYSGIGDKSSSRVLKPPGGGHSDIFGEPDACQIKARPKYNQQNSSNLSYCVGTKDANEKVAEGGAPLPEAAAAQPQNHSPLAAGRSAPTEAAWTPNQNVTPPQAPQQGNGDQGKPRVPPGGFSSGFW